MTRNAKDKSSRGSCPLTSSKRKRATANKLIERVKEGFPPGVAQPDLRALAAAGYTGLDQLTNDRVEELMALHGMGGKAIGILRAALKAKGKSFLS